MSKLFYFLMALFFGSSLMAQNGCDGQRYRELIFTDIDTALAVQFGENVTFNGDTQQLYMDIYYPANDQISDRPAIIWAFGGSFISGDREQLASLCHYSAQQGYVAVAIDYRLYDGPFFPIPDSFDFLDVAIKAMGDMKASVRKLREDAANGNPYQIDTNYIFAGGVSAGAITAMQAGFVDATDPIPAHIDTIIQNNGGIEGNSSSNYQYSSEIHAVINYSGALARTSWMDANDPPVFSVHDDGDDVVPYGPGFASISAGGFSVDIVYVEGSETITQKANDLGLTNGLITIPNSNNHVSYMSGGPNVPTWQDSVYDNSFLFLHNEVCGLAAGVDELSVPLVEGQVFPNPAQERVFLRLNNWPEGQLQLSLYDLQGRQLRQWAETPAQQIEIQRQQLPAGLYVLRLQLENGQRLERKVIFR